MDQSDKQRLDSVISVGANVNPSSSITTSISLTWQTALQNICITQRYPNPDYKMYSEQRGGRTAWSCDVQVLDKSYRSRFWYDGAYLNNAKEDAAEVALQQMGIIETPAAQRARNSQSQMSGNRQSSITLGTEVGNVMQDVRSPARGTSEIRLQTSDWQTRSPQKDGGNAR